MGPAEEEGGKTEPAEPDDQNKEDDSGKEPSDDTEEDISPADPSETEQGSASKDRTCFRHTDPGDRDARNLHDYFVSRKALHEKIYQVEYNDVEHAKYCDAIVAALKKGETIFNMGPWLSITAIST